MEMRIASGTDTGRTREINEDSVLSNLPLVAVADGMGGHVAGEVASKLAIEVLNTWKDRFAAHGDKNIAEVLREAFREVNAKVAERGSSDESLHGMGTTLTAAWIDNGAATVAHVGDSRAYLLRGDALQQITQDQTVAQEWVRRGRISAAEAETSPQRHVLLQAIGAEGSDLDVEIATVTLEPGDRLLLASDGLSGMIRDEEIRSILGGNDPDEAVSALIEAANDAGGQDNISVLIVEAEGEPVAGGAPSPVLVEKPSSAKRRRRFRPTVVLAAVLGVVAAAAIAAFFVAGVSAKSYVVSARRGHVVVLRGQPGSDDEPAKGKVVKEYRDKRVDRYAVPAQRELRTGIKIDSLSAADRVIADLPQKLGANERATPSPSPTPLAKSPLPKSPLPSVSPQR